MTMNYFPPSTAKAKWGTPLRGQRYALYLDWWLYTTTTDGGKWMAAVWQTAGVYQTKNYRKKTGFKTEAEAVTWAEGQAEAADARR